MAGKNHRKSNTNKITCEQCKMQIKEKEEDFIDCDKCAKKFHSQCTSLDKRQFQFLLDNEREMFVCHLCEGGEGGLKNELTAIKTKLNKLDQLTEIQEAIQFMSKQYDEILKGVAENKKRLTEVEKENKCLKKEIMNLKSSVKLLNDVRVKNDCVVNGLEVTEGATAVDSVIELSKSVGVNIDPQNIDEAYFIRSKKSSNRNNNVNDGKKNIVVKFSSKAVKDKLMAAKPKLKENENTNNVYVNDFLSRETLNLLNYSRSLKEVGYQIVYARNGKVFYKKSAISRAQVINSEEDVDKLLLNAATKKPLRRSMAHNPSADTSDDDDGELEPYVSS